MHIFNKKNIYRNLNTILYKLTISDQSILSELYIQCILNKSEHSLPHWKQWKFIIFTVID